MYEPREQTVINLKSLYYKSKLKFYQKMSTYYDEMNSGRQSKIFQFEEDLFAKNAQGSKKLFHEVF